MIEINDIDSSVDTVMSLLGANVARFFFETADFPAEAFQVTRFTGVEGISQPYRFTIDLVSQDSSIDFGRVVFQRAAFTMMRGAAMPVRIHGEIADFAQLGRVQHHAAYRAVLVPRLWRLRYQFRSHIFQRLTLQDLITEVLQGHDVRDVRFDLQGTYDPIEYCVQYQETDFDFICRLMEREGWFFYFEQDDQKETLVITDHQADLQAISGISQIPYREEEGMVTAVSESVQRFICRERAGWPGRVTLKDHHYETPNAHLLSSATEDAGYGDHYEYGEDHLATSDQGDERARRRMQALAGARHAFHGKSNCMGLRSGYRYGLAGHFRPDFNADYLLVKVKHRGGQESALGLAMNDAEQTASGVYYQNKFLCRRAEVPYRPPRRTPVPKVPGLMVAHIDHPDRSDSQDHGHLDEYAHLDADGRYKVTVNLDEDRSHPAADHSLPIHVAQHYAGPDYGTHFPLHGGVEVLLACINGDPNRPFIVGTVPNPNHTSPVTSANKTQNIVRTFSGNEMLMEDQEGITKISLTTPGGHNETLDDGQQRIIMTSAGGHMAKLDDANRNITAQTTGSHRLLMDDEGRQVILNTTDQHFLAMSDEEQYISLVTTNQHGLTMTDADQYITLQTTGEHKLRMDDAHQRILLKSAEGRQLSLYDDDKLCGLQSAEHHRLILHDDEQYAHLQSANGHYLRLDDQQQWAWLESAAGQQLVLNDQEGIRLESPSKRIDIVSPTEIKLSVGDNHITINQMGVFINGAQLTEIKGGLVTIN